MQKIIIKKIIKKTNKDDFIFVPKKSIIINEPNNIHQELKRTYTKAKYLLLKEQGLRYFNFLWNEEKANKIIELAKKENKNLNTYVWEILEGHLLEKEVNNE